MYYSKVRNVKSPIRANKTDAGIDFFIPKFNEQFIKDFKEKNKKEIAAKRVVISTRENKLILTTNARVLIPAGIHVNLEATKRHTNWDGIMLVVHNKSGIGSKKGLDRLAEVIDESYQGEIHISLVNTSGDYVEISEDDKIVQMILEEVSYNEPKELPFEDLYTDFEGSGRGAGGFGHTGN